MQPNLIRVLCVDDSPDIAGLLHAFIQSEPDMQSVGVLPDADRLFDEVSRHRPDVVVVDLTMPGRNPVEVIREMGRSFPETRAVVYSGYDDPDLLDQVIDAGAWGYVSKNSEITQLFNAIRRVARGELAL